MGRETLVIVALQHKLLLAGQMMMMMIWELAVEIERGGDGEGDCIQPSIK